MSKSAHSYKCFSFSKLPVLMENSMAEIFQSVPVNSADSLISLVNKFLSLLQSHVLLCVPCITPKYRPESRCCQVKQTSTVGPLYWAQHEMSCVIDT